MSMLVGQLCFYFCQSSFILGESFNPLVAILIVHINLSAILSLMELRTFRSGQYK
ncbi:hypothetical protein RO3G_12727 [Rhizopus delemar RA 99-880]|uniref:Uncharacterized protein n=1 Tax=Rhizopus delemar (strain RA 99-880 / ATCC MYA-4621 / FGSC 9543 / NRRL 43880) TaxID=246409 RepID=I1CHT6_RHIO9|nr:hypothetical protein RO3G_12727 [Rhizopus delemar RA 99-880]|eukprot:EIE88016.1 hypothetical protein RO3G_12727 [Rhizopus delemar RA 99-880]